MKISPRILIAVVLLAIAATVTLWPPARHWAQSVTGLGGPSNGALVLYGNVDIREVELAFRQSGRLTAMAFDEGDRVTAGAAALDAHVAAFAADLQFDLGEQALRLEDIWINILPEGGMHASHIHPHSVISGTTYVAMPEGASALKLEDPRSARMMAAPPRRKDARQDMRGFVYVKPQVGDVLLWESWLRHEVPMNLSEEDRISVSFNYAWK